VYINSADLEFGAWPLVAAGAAKVKFSLFFPNDTQYTSQQFGGSRKGPTYGDPQVALGVSAIEFLPWTAWADDNYGWGYTPSSFFSVEHRYTQNLLAKEDTIQRSRLQRLISQLHEAGIQVIMDGVFDHAGVGFAYSQFYLVPADCPYIGGWTIPRSWGFVFLNTAAT
jgi:pullulanase/glycogen debranching enzyme